jgi:hypothetical protein
MWNVHYSSSITPEIFQEPLRNAAIGVRKQAINSGDNQKTNKRSGNEKLKKNFILHDFRRLQTKWITVTSFL